MDDKNQRSRSRSPPRRAPKSNRGFRWKDNKSNAKDSGDREGDSGRRQDYRDRDHERPRARDDDDRRDRPRDDRHSNHSRRPREEQPRGDRYRRDDDSRPPRRERADKPAKDGEGKPRKEKKQGPAAMPPGQEMIVVNINDRLGTKSAIPCLGSDTVGQLKLMVAARIGREPGQIMLKRQGERPFKDHITLEDYGISNGVQLDLEVDTGD